MLHVLPRLRAALLAVALISLPAGAQDSPGETSFSDTVTVTATRVAVPWGESGRSVEVLTGDEIEAHGVRSVPELLQLFPGLDVRRRGVHGVQADLSVRGGSFEQVLVLVDGVPVNNPQTGHHTLDLPVPVDAIERVEVLYGPGSALYGANAAGGVVQIFTKAGNAERSEREGGAIEAGGFLEAEGSAELFAGEHSLSGGSAVAALDAGAAGHHRVTVDRSESQGYREGLEFEQGSGFYRGVILLGRDERSGGRGAVLDLSAGASERDFGAQSFYSTRFPNQLEFTEARFASAALRTEVGGTRVHAHAAGRWHDDTFILERSDPSLLTNVHEDRSVDLQVRGARDTAAGTLEVGTGWLSEDLDSTNLGLRDRERWGSFASLTGGVGERERVLWRAALHADRVDGDWEVHPSAALSVSAGSTEKGRGRARVSAASAYRVPSFTELYYRDPTSAGNPDLEPERSWTYEAGYDWTGERSRASATLFRREGSDLIDFVQAPGETLFVAVNLREVTTEGVELVAARRWGRTTWTASYAWLDSYGDEPAGVSAYVFDYLEHRAVLRADGRAPWDLRWGASLGWNDRNSPDTGASPGADDWLRLDARLAKRFGPVEVFAEGSNLTDERYVEQGAVEMPGRWLVGGVKLSR